MTNNNEKLNRLKLKLMEFTDIKSEYIDSYNIFLNNSDSIHVMIIDDYTIKNKPDVVFVHGLTGSSMQYFKCWKDLSKHMRIIALDLPGMGLSNRPYINPNEYDFNKTEDYFIERIDKALTILGIKRFHFISHSFGGYISCLYTMRFKDKVLSLILLSPVGISSHFVEIGTTNIEDLFQRVLYNLKKPPSYGYKIIGTFAKSFFERILTNKLKNFKNKDEGEVFSDLMQEIFHLGTSSENLIYKFFNGHIQAYKPICFYYETLENIKIDFIYGDADWNPIEHAEELKRLLPDKVDIHICSNSGHLLITDNPDELCKMIIKIYTDNKVYYIKEDEYKLNIEKYISSVEEENVIMSEDI